MVRRGSTVRVRQRAWNKGTQLRAFSLIKGKAPSFRGIGRPLVERSSRGCRSGPNNARRVQRASARNRQSTTSDARRKRSPCRGQGVGGGRSSDRRRGGSDADDRRAPRRLRVLAAAQLPGASLPGPDRHSGQRAVRSCRTGVSREPSDGLEPSTPSLPWRCSTD